MGSVEPSLAMKAIEIIYTRGWWQGKRFGPNGEVCLLTAMIETKCLVETIHKLWKPLEIALGGNPTRWQDHPSRTIEDVILLLKYADADELDTWKELYGDS